MKVEKMNGGVVQGIERRITNQADASSRLAPATIVFKTGCSVLSASSNRNPVGPAKVTLFGMSEQRDLPPVFERTHPKFKTPYVAIIVTAVAMLILTIQSSFLTSVAIATIARLLFYATTCLALPIFRRRTDLPKAPFSVPFGVVAAILSIGLIVWLLTNVDYAKEGLAVIVAAVIGLIIFGGFRLFLRSTKDEL